MVTSPFGASKQSSHSPRVQLAICFLLFLFLAGCQQEVKTARETPQTVPLFTFSKNSVQVTVQMEIETLEKAQIVATFTPTEPSLHLYGKELPLTGIEGVGRPTRVAVVSGILETTGDLKANVTTTEKNFPTFDEPFPLYPDGPVTLTLPVKLPASLPESPEVVLSISYMACSSEGVCKPPVTDYHQPVILPATIWH